MLMKRALAAVIPGERRKPRVVKEISVLGSQEGIDKWIVFGMGFKVSPGDPDLQITLIQE